MREASRQMVFQELGSNNFVISFSNVRDKNKVLGDAHGYLIITCLFLNLMLEIPKYIQWISFVKASRSKCSIYHWTV